MTKSLCVRWVLFCLALAGAAVPVPARANDPFSTCRIALDAGGPVGFVACIEPLRVAALDHLREIRQRLEVTEALVDRIIAQGGRDAATACAQSRVTLADLEAEASRMGQLEAQVVALRDAWRAAATGLAGAPGSRQMDQTTPVLVGYNMYAAMIVGHADGLATALRSARNYLVRVDPAGLCVGQPPPRPTAAAPAAAAPAAASAATQARGGVAITSVPAVTVQNRGARRSLLIHYSGALDFPVNVSLSPRPGGCFDGPRVPRGWRCGSETRNIARAEQAGVLELKDAVWCDTLLVEHKGSWTMKYQVTLTDRSGRTAGPQGVDLICNVDNVQ